MVVVVVLCLFCDESLSFAPDDERRNDERSLLPDRAAVALLVFVFVVLLLCLVEALVDRRSAEFERRVAALLEDDRLFVVETLSVCAKLLLLLLLVVARGLCLGLTVTLEMGRTDGGDVHSRPRNAEDDEVPTVFCVENVEGLVALRFGDWCWLARRFW